jgi:hypothetical protein
LVEITNQYQRQFVGKFYRGKTSDKQLEMMEDIAGMNHPDQINQLIFTNKPPHFGESITNSLKTPTMNQKILVSPSI